MFCLFPAILAGNRRIGSTPVAIFNDHQIAGRSQKVRPGGILSQAAIADFAIAEDLVDVPEGMLRLGTDTGFDFLGFQFAGIQLLPDVWTLGHEPGNVLAVLMIVPLLNATIIKSPKTHRSSSPCNSSSVGTMS